MGLCHSCQRHLTKYCPAQKDCYEVRGSKPYYLPKPNQEDNNMMKSLTTSDNACTTCKYFDTYRDAHHPCITCTAVNNNHEVIVPPTMIYKSIRFNGNSYTIMQLPDTDELFITYDIHGEYHEDTVSIYDFMFFQLERELREYLFEGGK